MALNNVALLLPGELKDLLTAKPIPPAVCEPERATGFRRIVPISGSKNP